MNARPTASAVDSGPLLIGIHGKAAVGKTSLAARLVADLEADVRLVGWLQPGQGERAVGRGADTYAWQSLAVGATALPYLVRDEACQPPYREVAETRVAADDWLRAELADSRPIDLLLVDEIGAMELAGGGHRARLDALLARGPAAVMLVLNSRHIEAVSEMLGQSFDVLVEAGQRGALDTLRDVLVAKRDFERVGWFGALAGAIEVGAGSVVHGAKLPMGGLGMATTQAAVLTRAAGPMLDRSRVAWVAVLASAIKSLSPAGQRLRPMLAIVMQGWLFARALRVLGWNLAGVMAGGFLMGVWAGSQGLLMQWLLFGEGLTIALTALNEEAARMLGWPTPGLMALISVWLALHGAAVAAGTAVAWYRPPTAQVSRSMPKWLLPMAVPIRRGWGAAVLHALREMLRPAFWLPLLLILGALAWAGQSSEYLVWVILRAVLIAWAMYVLVQRLDLPALPARLRRLGMWGPAIAWRRAMAKLASDRSSQ